MPTVSIGVPVFNGESSILRCLEGLHNQTLQPYEVIILDNCSTDRTAEICLDFAQKHRMRLESLKYKLEDFQRRKQLSVAGKPSERVDQPLQHLVF